MTVFRPFSESDALRSDRSAGDRKRHREKLRRAIRDNIADIIAEESIIGRDRDRVIRVPIRGVREYRFIYGDNEGGVGQGEGDSRPGQVVGRAGRQGQGGVGRAGNQPGSDVYETEITLEELVDIMFEDLELPDLERRMLRNVVSERVARRKGFRRQGIRVHLDRRRTALQRIKRKVATGQAGAPPVFGEEEPRFPFHRDDLVYRRLRPEEREESNAVVICIMDTSGSMDRLKKYLARSFFFLLYQFVCTKYRNVDIVFIAHHAEAKEVTEDEFFHRGESGGTRISSGYRKALEIIRDRYHPAHWNIYAFHCSDGDNFEADNEAALAAARELCEVCNLFGYGEIKPMGSHYYEGSMLERFRRLSADNFQAVLIERREDVWPAFRALMSRERQPREAA